MTPIGIAGFLLLRFRIPPGTGNPGVDDGGFGRARGRSRECECLTPIRFRFLPLLSWPIISIFPSTSLPDASLCSFPLPTVLFPGLLPFPRMFFFRQFLPFTSFLSVVRPTLSHPGLAFVFTLPFFCLSSVLFARRREPVRYPVLSAFLSVSLLSYSSADESLSAGLIAPRRCR